MGCNVTQNFNKNFHFSMTVTSIVINVQTLFAQALKLKYGPYSRTICYAQC